MSKPHLVKSISIKIPNNCVEEHPHPLNRGAAPDGRSMGGLILDPRAESNLGGTRGVSVREAHIFHTNSLLGKSLELGDTNKPMHTYCAT